MQSAALKDSPYSFKVRFEDESGRSATNPEELIAAAHASCFAMRLSHFLAEAGHPAAKLTTEAAVHIGPVDGGGQAISKSALTLRGNVPGMSEAQFKRELQKYVDKLATGLDVARKQAGMGGSPFTYEDLMREKRRRAAMKEPR